MCKTYNVKPKVRGNKNLQQNLIFCLLNKPVFEIVTEKPQAGYSPWGHKESDTTE